MFHSFWKLLNVTTILLTILQIKFALSNDVIKVINYSNVNDPLYLIVNCSNYQYFNYRISLLSQDDNNNILAKVILNESNFTNTHNNSIRSYIPIQLNAKQMVYMINITLEMGENSLIFYSELFTLSSSDNEHSDGNTIFVDLPNCESHKSNHLFINKTAMDLNEPSSSVIENKREYMEKKTTTFNDYERKPIHTKELETFPSLSLHPESIESLLKLDSTYAAARLPLTARKLNLR
ncbi:hypothetical protein C6P45_001431 [Maudiozyma exigua]|uniref:Uncharacterized protein n=1 Tax=Maudiozyma exigua TaxID=34358 RepID=A0A9P7B5L2_MAUEX|nr:hypothetical protein C6P45_001431 [Kazachstania exigua]